MSMEVVPLRLQPGVDLRRALEAWIGLLPEWRFRREHDPTTGYAELQISRKGACPPDSRQPLWGLGGCHCLQARLALLAASRRPSGGIAQAAGQRVKR